MNLLNAEPVDEQKLEKITKQLEDLVLDAIITILQKITKRNHELKKYPIPSQTDDMQF